MEIYKNKEILHFSSAKAWDVALCYGWVDGQIKKLKPDCCMRSFTPRRKASLWSKINIANCQRLIENNRMKPAGLAQIEAVKADGRWERAYVGSSEATLPADLLALIKKDTALLKLIESMKKSEIYTIYFQLATAASPATRQKRFDKILDQLKNKII